jgi:hypothetical protein
MAKKAKCVRILSPQEYSDIDIKEPGLRADMDKQTIRITNRVDAEQLAVLLLRAGYSTEIKVAKEPVGVWEWHQTTYWDVVFWKRGV